jgi:hypothetical protein
MTENDVKRTLRQLKKLEVKLRYGEEAPARPVLLWNRFFDLREKAGCMAKYTLPRLLAMTRTEFKSSVDEYWSFLYQELFSQPAAQETVRYNASALMELGLPADADLQTVKKRFHELAMQTHPDLGGDAERFIALTNAYKKLTGR